jgi:hypothetical protein
MPEPSVVSASPCASVAAIRLDVAILEHCIPLRLLRVSPRRFMQVHHLARISRATETDRLEPSRQINPRFRVMLMLKGCCKLGSQYALSSCDCCSGGTKVEDFQ